MIREFANGLRPADDPPYLRVRTKTQYRVEVLKKICDFYVVSDPSLNTVERGQTRIIRDLFELFSDWMVGDPIDRRIPLTLREGLAKCTNTGDHMLAPAHRAICDYLCTLTEHQAYDMFERLTGIEQASMFGAWFR